MAADKRRRRRRVKKRSGKKTIGIIALVILIVTAIAVITAVIISRRDYATISLKDFYFKTYSGYNGKGSIELKLDEGRFNEKITEALDNFNRSPFKDRDITEEDYRRLITTMKVTPPPAYSLKNGDSVRILYSCDLALAGRLNIRIEGREETLDIKGLKEARTLTVDDLFRDVSLSFSGQSPELTLTVLNESTDEFISNIVFSPVEPKEFYASGETVPVRAFFSEADCLAGQISVEKPSQECIREFTVEGVDEYLSSAKELPEEVIREAAEAGEKAFVDANQWGVRVFIEAGLVPVYVNKQATFKWLTPSVNKIYFKSVKEKASGKNGNNYNDLDIIYTCDMTQADGVTTSVRAVVRFSDIIRHPDGTLSYDFSEPAIISASHIAGNITKVVVDYFENDYYIEEIALN
ncbi:MAG TPA: hypothetical protein DCL38_02925 [Lachnospiraceae bacterium]|nr:hypothetical protein [Lachnospiraceae bacterium]